MSRHQSDKLSFYSILSDLYFTGNGNQKGFSLAEVMVAAGMLGVISLGVTQIMQNSAKTEKRLSQSVNLISLDAQVQEALSDTLSCQRTFGIPAPDTTQPLFAAAGAPGATGFKNALPPGNAGRAIYGGNSVGAAESNWRRVIEEYNATTGRGVYGSGSNTMYVKSIKYSGYLIPSPVGGLAKSSNYNSGARTQIPGTGGLTDGPHYYGDVIIYVDFRRGNPASYEALADDSERAAKARKSVSGSFSVPRFYKVTVRTNTSNKIVDCYANNQNLLGTYCRAVDGYLDPATGKCTNIKIRNSANAGDNWAITANTKGTAPYNNQRGNVLVEGGLNIGGTLAAAVPPTSGDIELTGNVYTGANAKTIALSASPAYPPLTQGNIKAKGDIIAGRDLQVTKELRSDKDALFKGRVNMGPNSIDTSNYLLKVTSSTANDKVIFDAGTSVLDVNNTLDTNGKVLVNNTTTEPFKILEGTKLVFKVDDNGTVHFYNGSGGGTETAQIKSSGEIDILQGSGSVTSIGTGAQGASYRPIVINNQPISLANGSLWKFTDGSYMGREVPTKAWVKKYVFRGYDDTKIADILDNIAEYAQHHKLDSIKSAMCSSINLRWKSATNSTSSGVPSPSVCAWDNGAKKCNCEPTNCSDDATPGSTGDVKACRDMFLRGKLDVNGQINSHSNIYASGSIFAQNIVQGADIIGTKIHTSNIPTYSVGTNWIYGNRLRSKDDVCIDNAGCYTRFTKQMCPSQQVMIGISHGQVVCTKVGD